MVPSRNDIDLIHHSLYHQSHPIIILLLSAESGMHHINVNKVPSIQIISIRKDREHQYTNFLQHSKSSKFLEFYRKFKKYDCFPLGGLQYFFEKAPTPIIMKKMMRKWGEGRMDIGESEPQRMDKKMEDQRKEKEG
jgi:hypothetical protein